MEYKDGQLISSLDCSWNGLPRTKDIDRIGMYDFLGDAHTLEGDVFFFSDIGETPERTGIHEWVGRMIASFKGNEGNLVTLYKDGRIVKEKVSLDKYEKTYKPICFIKNYAV